MPSETQSPVAQLMLWLSQAKNWTFSRSAASGLAASTVNGSAAAPETMLPGERIVTTMPAFETARLRTGSEALTLPAASMTTTRRS